LDEIRSLLLPWYLHVKFIHLLAVAVWSFSTAVAYWRYILPVFRAWEASPGDPERVAARNLAIERFDKGAILEHIAFPVALLSGLALAWLASWPWRELNWLGMKLGIILVIFLPMEIVDYYISHMGGNKRRIRRSGDTARYESMIRFHWRFFRVTTPLVVVFIPLLFYLAVTKPA